VARANVLAAMAPVSARVYNIGSGVETSLNTVATLLLRAMGSTSTIEHAPARKVNPVPRRLADTALARRDLGFTAQVPFETGIAELVEWWRGTRRPSEVTV
jgi:UDP-glucose 4-epimerase